MVWTLTLPSLAPFEIRNPGWILWLSLNLLVGKLIHGESRLLYRQPWHLEFTNKCIMTFQKVVCNSVWVRSPKTSGRLPFDAERGLRVPPVISLSSLWCVRACAPAAPALSILDSGHPDSPSFGRVWNTKSWLSLFGRKTIESNSFRWLHCWSKPPLGPSDAGSTLHGIKWDSFCLRQICFWLMVKAEP